jgi:hypothetical protein
LVEAGYHSEHAQVITCDFKPEIGRESRDVQNETISENNPKDMPLGFIFETLRYSLENEIYIHIYFTFY